MRGRNRKALARDQGSKKLTTAKDYPSIAPRSTHVCSGSHCGHVSHIIPEVMRQIFIDAGRPELWRQWLAEEAFESGGIG